MEMTTKFSDRVYTYNWIKDLRSDISNFINKFSFKTNQFEHAIQPAQEWDSLVINDMHEVIEKLGVILATFNTWYDDETGVDSEESILKELYTRKND